MNLGIVTISMNQARFLQEAIASVDVSIRHSLEYVIVDPGSSDGSRDIILRNQDRFSAVLLEPDKGPADGLNKGFSAIAKADVCGYLNADDRLCPGALDYVADYFQENEKVDILFGSIQIIDELGRRSLRGRHVDRVSLRRFADTACNAWQQATFFRRSAFQSCSGFNVENRISWDVELVIDMMLAGARVGYTSKALGDFRIYADSITGSITQEKNTRRIAEQVHHHRRISEKLFVAGYRQRAPIAAKLLATAYRLNPYRHLANFRVGLIPSRS